MMSFKEFKYRMTCRDIEDGNCEKCPLSYLNYQKEFIIDEIDEIDNFGFRASLCSRRFLSIINYFYGKNVTAKIAKKYKNEFSHRFPEKLVNEIFKNIHQKLDLE